jgi:hypothetical protein
MNTGNAANSTTTGIVDLVNNAGTGIRYVNLDNGAISDLQNGPKYNMTATVPPVEAGSDATLGIYWSRYNSGFTVTDAYGGGTSGNYHAMYAEHATNKTELSNLQALASTTPALVNATYTLVGNTSPTDLAGNSGKLNSLVVGANFSNQTITRYDLNATVAGNTWDAHLSGGPAGFSSFNSPQVAGNNAGIALTGTCAPACGPVTGTARGSFTGDQAQGLITSYQLQNAAGTNGLSGVAALKK